MKDFDTERRKRLEGDRTFTIGGEEFVRRASVAPQAVLRWSQMSGGEFVLKDADEKPVLDATGEPISTLTEVLALEIYDETIEALLEPGQEEAWKRVRAIDAALPITLGDMTDLVRWLFAEISGRPTGPPSESSDGSGQGGTGTNLTVVSSPPEEEVSTA